MMSATESSQQIAKYFKFFDCLAPKISTDFAMAWRLLIITAALYTCLIATSPAQNSIGVRKLSIEAATEHKDKSLPQAYILKLQIAYKLSDQEMADLKVAIDPAEEQNFQTVIEKRIRQGKGAALDFEIPIKEWKTEKLNVFILIQKKDQKPGDPPLANTTKVIERAALNKEPEKK